MKNYFDCKNKSQVMDVEKDDIDMLKQNKENKVSTRFAPSPYKIVEKKGNSVQIEGVDGRQKRRNVVHFKKDIIRTMDFVAICSLLLRKGGM